MDYNVFVKETEDTIKIRVIFNEYFSSKLNNEFLDLFVFKEVDEELIDNVKIHYNNDGSFDRVKITANSFKNISKKELNKEMRLFLKNLVNEIFTIMESGQKVYLDKKGREEYIYSVSASKLDYDRKFAKAQAILGLKEIILYGVNRKHRNDHKPKHNKDAKYGFYEYDITFSVINNNREIIYTGKLLIRNDANEKKYLYDIISIKKKID